MKEKVFCGRYAGHPVRFSFRRLTTHYYFGDFLEEIPEAGYDVRVSPEFYAYAKEMLPPDSRPGYIEYRACIGLTAGHLLRWDCCIFHAVSFVWKGQAWLLTGPSGIGKTTQFKNWQRLYPDEIQIISGDMPVLEKRDGAVFVHPSSWNGKENYRGSLSAKLGGIVILEQGSENRIRKSDFTSDVTTIFDQMLVRPETEEEIKALSGLIEAMFSAPVLRFVNLGNDQSTVMLRRELEAVLENKPETDNESHKLFL